MKDDRHITVSPGSAPGCELAGRVDAPAEWRRPLTGLVLGLLGFETLTGLTIYLLPFSVFNQFAVLLHTLLGLPLVLPIGWYLVRHWRQRYRGNFNHFQLLGYAALAALAVVCVSGFVLTWQAWFGTRINYTWDLIHIVGGFAFMGGMGAHLATLIWRRVGNAAAAGELGRAHSTCLRYAVGWAGGMTAICLGLAAHYTPATFNDAFPDAYSFKYGADRPFAPSLAGRDMSGAEERMRSALFEALDSGQQSVLTDRLRVDPSKYEGIVTVAERLCSAMDLRDDQRSRIRRALDVAWDAYRHRGAIDSRRLSGSASCGSSGCHEEIYKEWLPSAHRYSSMDFVFQEVQANMAREKAPEATRYCAGCHDPIALFSGAKNVGNVTLSAAGADEGISCLVCHCTVRTDVRGNADYVVKPPVPYVYEMHDGGLAKAFSDFLIRLYPRHHIDSYSRPLYKTAESCGACHKQFIDEELNDVGWVQGQNQYDSWRNSRWHSEGDPSATIGCRECHMPLQQSGDPARGDAHDFNRDPDDGKHRSHRFLGANQFVPRQMMLEGAEEHCALTVKWLQGEYEVPEINDRWTSGPAIRLDLAAPERAGPGELVRIRVKLTNNKTGHDFPTGPLDMIEAWVEVIARDGSGNIVFSTNQRDARGYLKDPKIIFKAELINRLGELITRHDLWNLVGARFKRSLFPGFSDSTTFEFECPAMPSEPAEQDRLPYGRREVFTIPPQSAGGSITVEAVLKYRKFSARFLDALFGSEAGYRSSITDVARATAVIQVVDGNGAHHKTP